jgi:thiol-disulfide isomerase/thioredoxin
MKKIASLLIIILLAGCFGGPAVDATAASQEGQDPVPEYEGKVNAPDFPEGLQWLNSERPISIRQLRGKIVLLDFWTYCCINCMHIIPQLKKLEKKYPNELVVIGVHTAKFTTEKETDNIRQAILRYEIEHPVVNDKDHRVWSEYAVRAWPTLMLIDPTGKVVGRLEGEGGFDTLDRYIAGMIAAFDAKKQLDRRPLQLALERHRVPAGLLAFPGKVLADQKSGQLFISDSNHNRIVVVSLADNTVKETIGAGDMGLSDGDYNTATFDHPQGMAYDAAANVLYVADTENHAIRAVDLTKRVVTTIAGTGEQSRTYVTFGGQGRQVALNSPWDLTLHDGLLYIAMAGPHQLWRMNPETGGITPYAGTGREGRLDGPLDKAALAQPSGITTDGKKLYFADSEVSSIRAADLDPVGNVSTIVGEDLFEFGDRDGKEDEVRLQHPLGVTYHDGWLYVADTYNNKIKRVSPAQRTSETFAGTGESGLEDGERAAKFDEPGGLSIAGDKLYVADTNNHAIRVVDLKTRRTETLQLRGLEKLMPSARAKAFAGEAVALAEQAVEPGDATLTINVELPTGYKLNALAPTVVKITSSGQPLFADGEKTLRNPQFPVSVPLKLTEGDATVKADLVIYYCEAKKESLCFFKEVLVSVPVKAKKGAGGRSLKANYTLKAMN